MSYRIQQNRTPWLVAGVMFGLCISYFWPHEPAFATSADRDSKFALITVPVKDVSFGGVRDTLEGVFVLDFLTGRLTGAVLNGKVSKFYHAYFRNVAADFQVDPQAEPHYTIVAGNTGITSKGRLTMATGVVYVGELSSGRVLAYGFPYNDSNRPVPPVQLMPLDSFQFREATEKE